MQVRDLLQVILGNRDKKAEIELDHLSETPPLELELAST
jgi:hypothetical protein